MCPPLAIQWRMKYNTINGTETCGGHRRIIKECISMIQLRDKESCRYDCLSLGEIMLRLDPADGRIRPSEKSDGDLTLL